MNRDNQQEIPTEAEIAWLGGIIEGKGSVSLSCYVRNEKSKPKMGTEIKLYNTDAGIIGKATDIIERLGLSFHLAERAQKPMKMASGEQYGGKDPMLILTVKRLESAYILGKLLHPWMFGDKHHRMTLIIQYLSRRLSKIEKHGHNVEIDKGDVEIVAKFYREHVKRPGHNRHLVEKLLRGYTWDTQKTV